MRLNNCIVLCQWYSAEQKMIRPSLQYKYECRTTIKDEGARQLLKASFGVFQQNVGRTESQLYMARPTIDMGSCFVLVLECHVNECNAGILHISIEGVTSLPHLTMFDIALA